MQNNSLAKVHSPVVDDVLFRERLFKTLDQARKKRTVWVTGMPGSGKTTLVASYLTANKLYHGWYHIDSSDADLATFFYYLRHVVNKLTPAKSSKLPLLTSEYLANISTYTRRYFEVLYDMLPKGFVLVFDNYHEINGNPLFHTIVNEALMRIPDSGNVILISRTDPPNTFSRLRANSMMEIIGNEQIKFTPDETKRLVRVRLGKEPAKEAIKKLYSWTDGWVAGIILMLQQHKMQGEAIAQGGLKNYQSIFDYFSAEIFDKMEPSTQDFLLRTSFFPSMTIEMANKMTGNQSSEKILAHLLSSHYFTIKHQNDTYQYHDLFREFLLTRASVTFNEIELKQIYKQAAMILQVNDKFEDAIGLFQKASDWENIKQIIIANAQMLILQGRNKVLETWIKNLPEKELNQDPWLLYWLGETRAVFNPVEGRALFEKAFRKFLSTKGNPKGIYPVRQILSNGVYVAWCGIIETFIYEYGNFVPIKKWVRAMEKIITEQKRFPSIEIEARVLSLLIYALIHYNPYHPRIEFWSDRTLKLLPYIKDPDQRAYYSLSTVQYYSWTGNVPKTGILVRLLQQITSPLSIKTQLLIRMYVAAYYRQIGLKKECMNIINDGLNIAH